VQNLALQQEGDDLTSAGEAPGPALARGFPQPRVDTGQLISRGSSSCLEQQLGRQPRGSHNYLPSQTTVLKPELDTHLKPPERFLGGERPKREM